jgi:putative membrane protein
MAIPQTTSRNLLLIIAVLVVLGIAGMAIGMSTMLNANDISTMGHEMTPGMFWGMLFGMVMGGIIIIAFFYFLFALVTHQESPQASAQMSAAEVLDQRYARGEISKDEYLERRKLLGE